MSSLNPAQFDSTRPFFHGTTHDIHDWVLPAEQAGTLPSMFSLGDPGGMSHGNNAFAVRGDEGYAWQASDMAPPGRKRVYEVAPTRDMYPGPWNPRNAGFADHISQAGYTAERAAMDEWASPSGFKVKGRIDTMPGRQGTFPEIDWNQYRGERNLPPKEDANHPSDASIKYGHALGARGSEQANYDVQEKGQETGFGIQTGRMLGFSTPGLRARPPMERDTPLPGMPGDPVSEGASGPKTRRRLLERSIG